MPAIGLYHRELLDDHILSAELAIMPFTEPGGQNLSRDLREELLKHANADAVVLKRADRRDFFQVGAMPWHIDRTIDLTTDTFLADMVNAVNSLTSGGARTLYVVAPTQIRDAQSIGIILGEAPIRDALVLYARRMVGASLFISALTASLVFVSLYVFVVRPMRRITLAMADFHENPEDAARIHTATRRADEIGVAERELAAMQRDVHGFLRQKTRLAALGAAVARIQHDLRNILANAQLASDRLAISEDPAVKRLAPRLVTSIDRAITLATTILQYGRADEAPPQRTVFGLHDLADDAARTALDPTGSVVHLHNQIEPNLTIEADREQLFRVILNLVRNAAEALAAGGGIITLQAMRLENRVEIDVTDSGPGICDAVVTKLFQPFVSAGRPAGTGLGLAIARDLVRGHGGELRLVSTGPDGTVFRIIIPDRN
ncbi:MAG: HAMP domain-containing histidine kinase [Alphaproteobacteria bacterium]|nr:HAMP domain-containing histidine kinase [Alphaproteobacteria bacterium]